MISTVKQPSPNLTHTLPFGYVQSPFLASLCLAKSRLGRLLSKLSSSNTIVVSVYVDDILISSTSSEELEKLLPQLESAAEKSNFQFNLTKQQGPSAEIEAFNIVIGPGSQTISELRFAEFLYEASKAKSRHQIKGIFQYIKSVDNSLAETFIDKLSHIDLSCE